MDTTRQTADSSDQQTARYPAWTSLLYVLVAAALITSAFYVTHGSQPATFLVIAAAFVVAPTVVLINAPAGKSALAPLFKLLSRK